MKRRRFVASSGAALFLGSAGLKQNSIAASFEIQKVPEEDPKNIDTILLEFSKLNLKPQYVDKSENPAKINISVDLETGSSANKGPFEVEFKNGDEYDISSEVGPISLPIESDSESLDGRIRIGIDIARIDEDGVRIDRNVREL